MLSELLNPRGFGGLCEGSPALPRFRKGNVGPLHRSERIADNWVLHDRDSRSSRLSHVARQICM